MVHAEKAIKSFWVAIFKVTDEKRRIQSDPGPLVSGKNLRIRIRTKMSRIRNTDLDNRWYLYFAVLAGHVNL